MSDTINRTKVKAEVQDRNPAIKEITAQYTQTIRLFMIFRGVICWWATFLPDSYEKRLLGTIILTFDLYLMSRIVKTPKPGTVLQTRSESIPAIFIQSSVVLAGFIFHFCWLYLGM